MKHLTKQQRQAVVQDFASGVAVGDLAFAWGVSVALIESILRQAIKRKA
jgi:DNA-directed RNA polymerase specialized sigma24 family protein